MQNTPRKKQQIGIALFVFLAVVSALISGYWAWSLLLWLFVYMLWQWWEFLQFYQWYMNGASAKDVPLCHGVFEALAVRVLHNKKQAKQVEKKNKYLLKQFNATAQALPYATIILNEKHEIQWLNISAETILGVLGNDLGKKVDTILRDPQLTSMLNSTRKDQHVKLPHPTEPDKIILLRLIRLHAYRYLLVGRDVSEQESLQKSRKAFVANASHELRTPLTVISGYLEMLQNSGQLHQHWTGPIAQALEQAQRMSLIIDGMLKLSSIEHDRHLESVDQTIRMPELLNSIYNDVRNSSGAKEQDFEAAIDSSLRLIGNESEITSLCLNLLRNAVIHNKPGTQIRLRWFVADNQPNFWVIDNGAGIDPSHMPHLTERFYKVTNVQHLNHQSTGLGLAIAKHICIKHGAKLDIESEVGQGSCFKVIFPSSRLQISN